jgi:hypothetical protein
VDKTISRWLLGVAVIATIAFAVVLFTRDPKEEAQLWTEVGRGLVQLIVIGVLGTALKLVVDAHQARRSRCRAARRVSEGQIPPPGRRDQRAPQGADPH